MYQNDVMRVNTLLCPICNGVPFDETNELKCFRVILKVKFSHLSMIPINKYPLCDGIPIGETNERSYSGVNFRVKCSQASGTPYCNVNIKG